MSFTGTSPELIQFALSHTATLDSSGEVDKGTDWKAAILSPGTDYKLIMYSNGSSSNIHSFSTEAVLPIKNFNQPLSPQNFTTNSTGKFQVPFVFSWKLDASRTVDVISIAERQADRETVNTPIYTVAFGTGDTDPSYSSLVTVLEGNLTEGAVILHTPRINSLQNYNIYIGFGSSFIYATLNY